MPEGVLAPHEDGCIALWTLGAYAEESRRQHLRSKESAVVGHEVRRWFSMCSDFSLDQQGRMLVPPGLRDHAQIVSEVLFFGVFDRGAVGQAGLGGTRALLRELGVVSHAITGDSVPTGSARVIRSPLAGAQDGSSLSAATLHPRLGIRPSYLDAAGGCG